MIWLSIWIYINSIQVSSNKEYNTYDNDEEISDADDNEDEDDDIFNSTINDNELTSKQKQRYDIFTSSWLLIGEDSYPQH